MSFSRSHRRISSSQEKSGRDRHEIVGLSGWLFADLLLAVAVIFLVASIEPVFSSQTSSTPDPNPDESPVVSLAFVPPLPIPELGGMPVWNEADRLAAGENYGVVVEVNFSEPVTNFGESIEDIGNDIKIVAEGGEVSGWKVQNITLEKDSNGTIYSLLLEPSLSSRSGKVSIQVVAQAVLDGDGNTNAKSVPLDFLVQSQKEKRIDTENSSQLTIDLRGRSCNDSNKNSMSDDLAKSIKSLSKWLVDVADDDNKRREVSSASGEGNFGQWIEKNYGETARVGFVFIYGPGADGRRIASKWQECIFTAFKQLKYLDIEVESLAYKTFKDEALVDGKLKLEIYFYADSNNK